MKWFKHYSAARFDPKIRRLIKKYGIEGYGLYFAIVETIAFQLESNSPLPDLEENANDIALFFGMDTVRVEEIIKFCIEQELFQAFENGKLLCLKLLAHLDNTMSSNPEIRNILSNFSELQETLSNLKQIDLKQIRLDKIRLDKKKKDASPHFTPPTIEEIKQHILDKRYTIDPEHFWHYYNARDWKYKNGQRIKSWKSAMITWLKNNEKWARTKKDFDYEVLG